MLVATFSLSFLVLSVATWIFLTLKEKQSYFGKKANDKKE